MGKKFKSELSGYFVNFWNFGKVNHGQIFKVVQKCKIKVSGYFDNFWNFCKVNQGQKFKIESNEYFVNYWNFVVGKFLKRYCSKSVLLRNENYLRYGDKEMPKPFSTIPLFTKIWLNSFDSVPEVESEDTRLEAKDTKKNPRTDLLEAKDTCASIRPPKKRS